MKLQSRLGVGSLSSRAAFRVRGIAWLTLQRTGREEQQQGAVTSAHRVARLPPVRQQVSSISGRLAAASTSPTSLRQQQHWPNGPPHLDARPRAALPPVAVRTCQAGVLIGTRVAVSRALRQLGGDDPTALSIRCSFPEHPAASRQTTRRHLPAGHIAIACPPNALTA